MRVSLWTLLTGAVLLLSSPVTQPALAHQAKASCPCACPEGHKIKAHRAARPMAHRTARHGASRSYRYAMAAPVRRHWHGRWQVAPNDAYLPEEAYGPPPADYGLTIDDRGWTGGVGDVYGGDGGGYGQLHVGTGVENGPTYNSYDQSFQYNPSQPGPFQNRLMGGFAPPARK